MKRINYYGLLGAVAGVLFLSGVSASAQAPADAYRNALEGISGTARAQGLSGAVGALGADPTAVWVNPAGIGLYHRSIISLGVQGSNARSNTNWTLEGDNTNITTKYNLGGFNNFTYIGGFGYNRHNSDSWRINFGMQYNRDYDYKREYNMQQILPYSSLPSYIANRANQGTAKPVDYYAVANGTIYTYDPRYEPLDQIVVLGMNAQIIEGALGDNDPSYRPNTWVYADNTKTKMLFLRPNTTFLQVKENGSKSSVELTFGAGYNDRFYFGASLRATTVSYSRNSNYNEDYYYQPTDIKMGVTYNNELKTDGNIVGVNLGAMFAVGDYGRVGISYLTPQFGIFEDNYYAYARLKHVGPEHGEQNYPFDTGNDYMTSTYNTVMPGKLTLSAMAFLSKYGMVTYDFQYRNLGSSRINPSGVDNSGVNQFIKEDLGNEFGHRVGIEIRPARFMTLRGGYSYLSSGMKAPELKSEGADGMTYEFIPSGTIVDYTIPENYQTYSAGLGFQIGRSTSLDFAYVHGVKTERAYPFPGLNQIENNYGDPYPAVYSVGAKMKNTENRFVGTLTFTF